MAAQGQPEDSHPQDIGGKAVSDPLKPAVSVLCRLGSIAVHVDEMLSDDGHAFDCAAIKQILADNDLRQWLSEMDKMALLPKKRKP
jgi:hypothetical protein